VRPRTAERLCQFARLEHSRQRPGVVEIARAVAGECDRAGCGAAHQRKCHGCALHERAYRGPGLGRKPLVPEAGSRQVIRIEGLLLERPEVAGDVADDPSGSVAQILCDGPVVRRICGRQTAIAGRVLDARKIDRSDLHDALRDREVDLDLQEREEPAFEIAQIAFEPGKAIANPRFETRHHRIASDLSRRGGWVLETTQRGHIARQQLGARVIGHRLSPPDWPPPSSQYAARQNSSQPRTKSHDSAVRDAAS
jgi:hypothetical protein